MRKQRCGMLCALLLAGILACGCGARIRLTSGFGGEEIFQINGEVCTLPEAKVFLTNYQNLYSNLYGVNLWKDPEGKKKLEQYVKDVTVTRLAQITAMDCLAREKGLSLSEEEQRQVEKAAAAYYDSLNEAEKKYMQISQGDVVTLYSRYGLANKLYADLTGEVEAEVSDDDARVMRAMQIFVTDQAKAEDLESQLKNGADFTSLAARYNEKGEVEVQFGREDVPKEIESIAFSMENGQVSGKIAADKGWYFIKCLDHYDQKLTDANKSVILEQRRKEAFDNVYEAYLAEIPSDMNEKAWEEVEVVFDEDITTDRFFELYSQYCEG